MEKRTLHNSTRIRDRVAAKRLLPHTFPRKIVFILSLVLCLCACACIIVATIAWNYFLWGYYWGTGFWTGGVVLLAGIFGIVCSITRNTCSVKTFMIISIFGCLVSLAMIALSSGGLDSDSGFYEGVNSTMFLTGICHGANLGLGVLQCVLCLFSDFVCIYYLFIEKNAVLYRVSDSSKKNSNKCRTRRRQWHDRSNMSYDPVVVGISLKPRNSKTKRAKNLGSIKCSPSEDRTSDKEIRNNLRIHYAPTKTLINSLDRRNLRKQNLGSISSPALNSYNRSASFSTFGHFYGPQDHVSLIVHADDINSVVDSVQTHSTADHRLGDECHYAQTLLLNPPLPIEEDDVLPPYEASETRSQLRKHKRPRSEDLPNVNKPIRNLETSMCRKIFFDGNKSELSQTRLPIPFRRDENVHLSDKESKRRSCIANASNLDRRLCNSADVLLIDDSRRTDNEQSAFQHCDAQHRSFRNTDGSFSYNKVLERNETRSNSRSQSLKVNREKRIDRKRRALSVEIKKSQIILPCKSGNCASESMTRASSFDGSNSILFAGNRTIPTKFSLRRPVSQIGVTHIPKLVPVKSIKAASLVPPPTKPPRTHSITADDFNKDYLIKNVEILTNDAKVLEDINTYPNDKTVNAVSNSTTETTDEKDSNAEYDSNATEIRRHAHCAKDKTNVDKGYIQQQPTNELCPQTYTGAKHELVDDKTVSESSPLLKRSILTHSRPTISISSEYGYSEIPFNPSVISGNTESVLKYLLPVSPIVKWSPSDSNLSYRESASDVNYVHRENLNMEAEDRPKIENIKDVETFSVKKNEMLQQERKSACTNDNVKYASIIKNKEANFPKPKRLTCTVTKTDVNIFEPVYDDNTNDNSTHIFEVKKMGNIRHPIEKQTFIQSNIKVDETIPGSQTLNNDLPRNIVHQEQIVKRKTTKSSNMKSFSDNDTRATRRKVSRFPNTIRHEIEKDVANNGARPKAMHRDIFRPLQTLQNNIAADSMEINLAAQNGADRENTMETAQKGEDRESTMEKNDNTNTANTVPAVSSNIIMESQHSAQHSAPSEPSQICSSGCRPLPDSIDASFSTNENQSVHDFHVQSQTTSVVHDNIPTRFVQNRSPVPVDSQGISHLSHSRHSIHLLPDNEQVEAINTESNFNALRNNNVQPNNDSNTSRQLFAQFL